MQTTSLILLFVTIFLAIFAPWVAYIHKAEHKKYITSRKRQREYSAERESEAAWILNRRLMR